MSRRAVGRALPHESAHAHVDGSALYTDDLASRFRGLLSAWPVMAPHAHARLTKLDVAGALDLLGVVHVLTEADVPGENDTGASRRDEPLFPRGDAVDPRGEILFHGMPVAWVLAETEEIAKKGAARVLAEYEPLPAIVTMQQAIEQGSFQSDRIRIRRGDPEHALARASHVVEGELEIGGQEHFYLETHASIAYLDEDRSLFVHSSTQHPTETQEIVARVCGLAKNEVVVQQLRMGGGFGGKETQANPFAAIAGLGALVTGRPVRVRLDRARDVTLSGKRHPFLGRYRAAHDERGVLEAVVLEMFADGGYSIDLSIPVLSRAIFHADNAYFLANCEIGGRVLLTHKTSQTAFRGFGGPQGMVMIEEILDRVARATGLAPEVVRERNLYRPGHTTHYEQTVEQADRLERIWHELSAESELAARREAIAAFNARSPHTKRGIAITPVKFGISFTAKFYNQAGALVLVYKDGTVQVSHGGTEMGQGLYTKVRQIAADALGIPLERVRVMATRTDKVPNTSATAASSGTDLNGAAVKDACDTLRARLCEVASRMLSGAGTGGPADEIVIEDGRVHRRGAEEHGIDFAKVVERAYYDRVPLSATGFYKTPDLHYDATAGRGKPFHYFAYGAAVTEVEVDGFTGMYRMLRVDILHDVGESISPLVDLGQVEGAYAQGVGWLTQEELVWDAKGVLRTPNASTYKLPSLGECPEIFRTRLLPRAAQERVVHGSKAVGEPPFMLAISAREALREAVAAFAKDASRVKSGVALGSPATAEQVYWAIERVRGEDAHVAISGEASTQPTR